MTMVMGQIDELLLSDSLQIPEMATPGGMIKKKIAKRAQVPKACSNCRKNHAACGTERPCKRCLANGLEDSCTDVPRKKRVSKKKAATESMLPDTIIDEKMWEDTYNELFGTTLAAAPNNSNSSSPPSFQPETLLLTEFGTEDTSMALAQYLPEMKMEVEQKSTIELLIKEMAELRNSNLSLESKLLGVTKELSDLRESTSMVKSGQLISPTPWHSFRPQAEVAISVWQNTEVCGRNVLVECNERFVQLVGYPMDVLRNNFTCDKLILKTDCKRRETQKDQYQTQIVTASGLHDVLMQIIPIGVLSPGADPSFYILHIVPI